MSRDNYSCLSIFADTADGIKAANIFADEIKLRTRSKPDFTDSAKTADIVFHTDDAFTDKDSFSVSETSVGLKFSARSFRGLMFAAGLFLRKTEYYGENIRLIEDIIGNYSPLMKIRGHQLGYRTTTNTYEAWDIGEYERYYKDLMFFGVNTVEHIPVSGDRRNKLMKYSPEEMCALASEKAEEYDLDVSLWYPNDEETDEAAVKNREKLFAEIPRIDAVFPPGGDPGDMPADKFIKRIKAFSPALKHLHPNAEMWPSAQAPHSIPGWGDAFIDEMNKIPEEIDGVILGPNRAMDLDELRLRLPEKYPIRLYPDITHNVRCEYPVHFNRNDWHYAWAATESRECINPRPAEYRLIHRLTRPYIIGSVSYSEGVNDDLNKMIWSYLDYFGSDDVRTATEDYCRLFFPKADTRLLTEAIFGLENNWNSAPEESNCEIVLDMWLKAGEKTPSLYKNRRYIMHLFRASCDALVKMRRLFELRLIKQAEAEVRRGKINSAKEILMSEYPNEYIELRKKLEDYAEFLYKKIGMQLDVKRYSADSWERGATLDTIDNNITNRAYYIKCFDISETLPEDLREEYIKNVFRRETAEKDGFYYSVALHGLESTGFTQDGEVYLNFRGDNPDFNAQSSPVGIMNVYDNYSFKCKVGGLNADGDYKLRVTYLSRKNPNSCSHKITFNGKTVYIGSQFGTPDSEYDKLFLPKGFESAIYTIPSDYIINGCGILEISEDTMGVMFSEFSIFKDKEGN